MRERTSLGNEVADGRDERQGTVTRCRRGEELLLVHPDQDAGVRRLEDDVGSVEVRPGKILVRLTSQPLRKQPVDGFDSLPPDVRDHGARPYRVGHVVDVVDERAHTGEEQGEGHPDGDRRDEAVVAVDWRPHLAQHEKRVHERGHEQPQHDLVGAVAQERSHDARGELARRQLEDEHRDREHEPGEREHRLRDRGQNRAGALGRAAVGEEERAGVLKALVHRGEQGRQADRCQGEDCG